MDGSFLVNTTDLGEAESILSTAFAAVRLSAVPEGTPTRSRIWRTEIGPLLLDETHYTFDLSYDMEPPDQVLLCRMRSGVLQEQGEHGDTAMVTTGETIALAAAEGIPATGFVSRARYDLLAFDRRLLNAVASPMPDDKSGTVRLTASTTATQGANQRMVDLFDYVRHGVVANPDAVAEPLVFGYLSRFVAASILSAFPNNASLEPSFHDRNAATPRQLRRAMAYIDENAHSDLSLADIATAIRATPQAVTLMFCRHLGSSPSAYLRRVRLHCAHTSLANSDPRTTTVGPIAHRWGFANLERFTDLYRRVYGKSPRRTLDE